MYDRNPEERYFGTSEHKVPLSEGSSSRDSTVFLNMGFSLNFHIVKFSFKLFSKNHAVNFIKMKKGVKFIGHDFIWWLLKEPFDGRYCN